MSAQKSADIKIRKGPFKMFAINTIQTINQNAVTQTVQDAKVTAHDPSLPKYRPLTEGQYVIVPGNLAVEFRPKEDISGKFLNGVHLGTN